MFKELEIMKALRYLLMVVAMISVMSVHAQGLAKMPEAQMRSTSTMVYSGSSLPQAATTGAVLTGSKLGSYAPAYRPGSKPRRVIDGDDEGEKPGSWSNPYEDPIGDAAVPMMVMALAFCGVVYLRRKKRTLNG